MSNIIGDPFQLWVQDQIKVRQSALGQKSEISPDILKYYTTKTPWLRLASSINLEKDDDPNVQNVLKKLTNAGINENLIVGDKLAKNFILQGGAVSLEETTDDQGVITSSNIKLNKGLNYSNDLFNGAYGWGGINERGYVPMPGITSATTTYYNNGALSKATINIKCFSKTQFQLLDVLYLRPGYTLLLEFGWSTYLNNDGNLETYDGFKSQPLTYLLNPESEKGGSSQFTMLRLIKQERQQHSGNYEAVYGKITNFKWTFDSDGSYNCEVNLIGMGSVIEALKLNVSNPKSNNQSGKIQQQPTSLNEFIKEELGERVGTYIIGGTPRILEVNGGLWSEDEYYNYQLSYEQFEDESGNLMPYLKEEYNKQQKLEKADNESLNANPLLKDRDITALNRIFYDVYQKSNAPVVTTEESTETVENIPITTTNTTTSANANAKNADASLPGTYWFSQYRDKDCFILSTTKLEIPDPDNGGKDGKSVYMKLSAILYAIETYCNLFSGREKIAMVKFDFRKGNGGIFDKNYMAIIPPNISTDPNICLVPYTQVVDVGNIKGQNQLPIGNTLNKLLSESNFLVDGNKYAGRLGNVLINVKYAAKCLRDAASNSDNSVSVLSYIKTLLQGINSSMGGINDFMVTNDSDDGLVKIYDQTPIIGLNTKRLISRFNVFGVKDNDGSFVTNIGLDASIPSDFADLISIGASQSGNNMMGNATSFSNYNKGLIDRILPDKVSYEKPKSTASGSATPVATQLLNEKIYYIVEGEEGSSPFYSLYVKGIKKDPNNVLISEEVAFNFSSAVTSTFKENYTTYIKLIQGELSKQFTIPSPFFLPFNLNLEIEGLSGMRLFEKFRINNDILPPSYEDDGVDIIIKALNHSIDTQRWSTTIDTLSVPSYNTTTDKSKAAPVEEKKSSSQQEELEEAAEGPNNDNKERVPPNTLSISANGVNFIKKGEGFRANAYQDSIGIWTIGYGTTAYSFDDDDEWEDLIMQAPISESKAEELLRQHIINNVQGYIYGLVKVDLTQGEFDALVSFIYNVGSGNFQSSTMLQILNKEDYEGAVNQFPRFNKAGGTVLAGLTKRRHEEMELFLA